MRILSNFFQNHNDGYHLQEAQDSVTPPQVDNAFEDEISLLTTTHDSKEENWEKIYACFSQIYALEPEAFKEFFQKVPFSTIKNALIKEDKYGKEVVHSIIEELVKCYKAKEIFSSASVSQSAQPLGVLETLYLACSKYFPDGWPRYQFEAQDIVRKWLFLIFAPSALAIYINTQLEEQKPTSINNTRILVAAYALILFAYLALVIYKKGRSIPRNFSPMQDYIKAVGKNQKPLLCRDAVIEKIFLCWQSTNNALRQHPLLVSPAGTGKTVVLMELARRIARGEVPHIMKKVMQDKLLIGGPATFLISGGSENQSSGTSTCYMKMFLQDLEPYKNETILALDEIQRLLNEKNGSTFGELLKSVLDTGLKGLPYFIATTTDHEYKKYIANDPARARRFKVIYINPMGGEDIKVILCEMLRRHYSSVFVSDEALDDIYDSTQLLVKDYPQLSQPEISKHILVGALSKISLEEQKITAEETAASLKIRLASLRARYLNYEQDNMIENSRVIADITKQIEAANIKIAEERQSIAELNAVTERIVTVKNKLTSLALKIHEVQQDKMQRRHWKKKFLFLFYYLLPYLKNRQEGIREKRGVPKLDKKLVQQLIDEFIQNTKAATENTATTSSLVAL